MIVVPDPVRLSGQAPAACGDIFVQGNANGAACLTNTLAPVGLGYGVFATLDGDEANVGWASPNAVGSADDLDAFWMTLLEDLAASDKAEKALSKFESISHDMDRLTALAETAPGAVAAERAIILKALTRDLARALAALDAQRIATIETLQNERVAVMDDVKRERAGLSADITAERIAMLKEIERQRQETLANIEAIGKRLLDSALTDSKQNVDHFFFRVLQVGGLLVAVVLIFCTGAIYYVHRGRR